MIYINYKLIYRLCKQIESLIRVAILIRKWTYYTSMYDITVTLWNYILKYSPIHKSYDKLGDSNCIHLSNLFLYYIDKLLI